MVKGYDVVLTQGFIARTPKGDTCLLGRGGSDTSASLFGALIGAEVVEVSTRFVFFRNIVDSLRYGRTYTDYSLRIQTTMLMHD